MTDQNPQRSEAALVPHAGRYGEGRRGVEFFRGLKVFNLLTTTEASVLHASEL